MPEAETFKGNYEKMLLAERLHRLRLDFVTALRESKKLTWADFEKRLIWIFDDHTRNEWTQVLQWCKDNESKTYKGEEDEEVTVSYLPWENPAFWQPFIRALDDGLAAWLKDPGEVLSTLAYLVGPWPRTKKDISDIRLHYELKAQAARGQK